MKPKIIRFDEIDISEYHWQGPKKVGTLGWDSNSGCLSGTLALKVKDEADRAKRRGSTNTIHPITGRLSRPHQGSTT